MNDAPRPLRMSAAAAYASVAAFAGAAAALDLTLHARTPFHATLVAALPVLTALATWSWTRRGGLTVAAAGAAALLPLPHLVEEPYVAAALGVGFALFLRPRWKPWEAIFGLCIAALVALVALRDPLPAVVAGLLGGAMVFLRPALPTEGVLRTLRGAGLWLPFAGFVFALLVNASTRRAEHLADAKAVLLGASLFGLFVFVGLALMGLATLLESRQALQQGAWFGMMVAAAVVAASLATLDPDAVVAAFTVVTVPGAALAVLASARLRWLWPRLGSGAPWVAAAAAVAQWGLQV